MEILLSVMLVIIAVLGTALFFIVKSQRRLVEQHSEAIDILMEKEIKEARKAQMKIEKIEKDWGQEVDKKQEEIDAYKQSVLDNFNDGIPYGERFIMRTILKLLGEKNFNNYTFYHQVEYQDNERFYQLDFLVVSPFGVTALESKCWNGVTYIYNNSYSDIFRDTLFKNFGIGSSEKIKIFNAKFSEENEKKIIFSNYPNPVSQVRKYSLNIRKQLKLPAVRNAVVFHKSDISNILFNDQKLDIEAVDDYTKIITSEAIKEYFIEESKGKTEKSSEEIINSIESCLTYKTKLDKSNYQDKLFSYLLSS